MPELMPWHKTLLIDPEYTRVDLVKEGANSKAHIRLFKNRGGKAMEPKDIIAKLAPEHQAVMNEFITNITKAAQDAESKLEEVTKAKKDVEEELEILKATKKAAGDDDDADGDGDAEEKILKSVKDPAVRALLETQIAKAKVAEAEVRKAREAAIEAEAVAKAKEAGNLGAEEAKLAEIYKSLKTKDPQLCDEVFGILKAASAVVAEGAVFKEVGGTGAAAEDYSNLTEDEAWAKIEKAAESLIETQGITKSKAIANVIDSQPGLYQSYVNAQLRG